MRYLFFILIVFCGLSVIKAQNPQNKEKRPMVVITDKMRNDFVAKQKLEQPDANANKVLSPAAEPILTKEDSAMIRQKKANYLRAHKKTANPK